LVGDFQVSNALAALGLAVATGADPEAAMAALESLQPVPGRLERVALRSSGAAVYVDYAHTPDALAAVLKALRPQVGHRLVVVFGCGGDRDRGKRPEMGRIAAALADGVIVTDDNPRGEEPAAIRRQILAACPGATEIGDRAEAIANAVSALQAGDVLVVAGKGHETGQIIGDRVLPFDDAAVVRSAVREIER
jgi:UDP-N-acetylmuramoyl-L-alanyl-D-glutamate--2,6-diaminopimelate ligase